ncbi:hypothetical protein GYMLUDRAFT_241031, partial [Collybiopsis luxurians FD-317 M1]
MQEIGNIFPNAHHFTINGGIFTVTAHDEIRNIRDWLQAPDCSANRAAAADKKTKGTGQWILNHPEYQKWKGQPSTLWIQGKAGSGKTVLSTTIWKDLSDMDTDAFWYHYFDIRDNTGNKSSYHGFLLSLVSQMGLDNERINPDLYKLYRKLKGHEKPAIVELEEILEIIIVQRNAGYLLVDAMDECTKEASKVMAWLYQFSQKLWIVGTSRNFADHRIEKSVLKIVMDKEDPHTQRDMEEYIQTQLQSAEHNFNLEENYWKHVAETLKEGANGQFRWAECQLKGLEECSDKKAVEAALKNLPKDLEDIYSQAVKKAKKGQHAEDVHHLLLWLLYAYRPLNESQGREILAINIKQQIVKDTRGMKSLELHAIVDSSLVVIGSNKLLLENGANVNSQGGRYRNALQVAVQRNNGAVVKLLLENGADVKAQGCFYGNALQAAALRGNEAVVKLLLENGADVNAQG